MDLSSNLTRRPLCVNGCGFYGSEETKNILSRLDTKPSNPSITPSSETLFEDSGSKATNTSTLSNRCKNCSKKVGLMGFQCRCGDLFCAMHRYAIEHSCPFDYKKFDREILIKENQLIKGDKLPERI
ncbi:hypothetical protein ACOSP7_027276 [Xanthoceras sorbifolium]